MSLWRNQVRGKQGEGSVKVCENLRGYCMERKYIGKDFIGYRRSAINPSRIVSYKNIEAKTGNSQLSERQRYTQRTEGLEVCRVRNTFPYV